MNVSLKQNFAQLTERQKELQKELVDLLSGRKRYGPFDPELHNSEEINEFKDFLDQHENDEDLGVVMNTQEFVSAFFNRANDYSIGVIDLLLEAGADPNVQEREYDSLGRTPLHYAASYGHEV
ncbi:ankyrin repeat domain-containing protein [Wolbachia endosymbiont of Ctenocephalides felis wCfeT]|uniref:ankyrin repeat domain-containing protein n=1 Tax=Wolbachia endosymbiont of Ctenocephalides felis wCfeT TaxID=2732593 RepID=UPI001446BFE6|nr:ankyrin repeat domain-containing protein [Wolbachia endosymbiont of Ctenocephalides felis wCfeT]